MANTGEIIKAKRPGGRNALWIKVIGTKPHWAGFVLGRRVRFNDDGSISTYGNERAYRPIREDNA
jgi:hypothetical protein